jgi:hypothetical protein
MCLLLRKLMGFVEAFPALAISDGYTQLSLTLNKPGGGGKVINSVHRLAESIAKGGSGKF